MTDDDLQNKISMAATRLESLKAGLADATANYQRQINEVEETLVELRRQVAERDAKSEAAQ